MLPGDEDRALLDAIHLVTQRLVAESKVNYEMLGELEELRQKVERDLRSQPIATPDEIRRA